MANYRLLASVISASQDHQVVGRLRLQKTVTLMQAKGLKTDYLFRIHHFGPYCDEINSDIALLEKIGLIEEQSKATSYNRTCYYIKSKNPQLANELEAEYHCMLNALAIKDTSLLELAATYQYLLDQGDSSELAFQKTRRLKSDKWSIQAENDILSLLAELDACQS